MNSSKWVMKANWRQLQRKLEKHASIDTSGSKHLPVKLQLVEGIRAKQQKHRRTQRIEEEGL